MRTLTENISTGGLYFETACDDICQGEQLNLELNVSGNEYFFSSNNIIQALAEVVRVTPVQLRKSDQGETAEIYGVGLHFSDQLKLVL